MLYRQYPPILGSLPSCWAGRKPQPCSSVPPDACSWSPWTAWTQCSCSFLVQQRYRNQWAAGGAAAADACVGLDGQFRMCDYTECSGEGSSGTGWGLRSPGGTRRGWGGHQWHGHYSPSMVSHTPVVWAASLLPLAPCSLCPGSPALPGALEGPGGMGPWLPSADTHPSSSPQRPAVHRPSSFGSVARPVPGSAPPGSTRTCAGTCPSACPAATARR